MSRKFMRRNIVLVCIRLVIVYLFFSFAGAIGMGIIAPKIFGFDLSHPSALSNGQRLIMLAVGTALTTVIIFSFRKIVDKKTITSLGLMDKQREKNVMIGFGFGALSQIIAFLVLIFLGGYKLNSFSYPSAALVFAFLIAVVVAWQEELFFRAYMIENLKIFSGRFAVVASAVIFVIPHISGRGFSNTTEYVSIFIFGILAGFAYLKSQSIFMPLGFHLGFNFIGDVLLRNDIINGELLYSGLRLELPYWTAFALVGFLLMKFLKWNISGKEFATKEQNLTDFVNPA